MPQSAIVPDEAPIALEVPEARERHSRTQDNAYTLYLREIGQTKLITPQEEIVLAKRIAKGDDEAREQMIKANLRLVVKIARDYEEYGLPLLDLVMRSSRRRYAALWAARRLVGAPATAPS